MNNSVNNLAGKVLQALQDGNHVSLIGEWGSGKTSTLHAVRPQAVQNGYRFIYLNLQTMLTDADFFGALCEAFTVPPRLADGSRYLLAKAIAEAAAQQKTILALDELEIMAVRMSPALQDWLRGLGNEHDRNLLYLFVSRSPLNGLLNKGVGSPLYNIFWQIACEGPIR
jgi:Cdc6-like AAA superfamily ATPase